MASDYPGAIDTFATNTDWSGDPNAAPATARITAADVNNVQDAIVAVQDTLGVNPQGSHTDVAARLAALTAPDWTTGAVYVVGQLAANAGTLYRCATAHTAGVTFDASKFTAIGGGGGGAVSSVVGQTGAVTGTQILADSTVAAALAAKASTASVATAQATADAAGVLAASKADAAATTSALAGKAPTTRAITAGTGLTGGGDLSADRSLTVTYGTTAGTAAQGDDTRITGAAQKAANLSDLASASTARTNLGLGSAATMTPATIAADSALTGTYGRLAGPNTWTGTQDFTGATVTGVAGGGGSGLPSSFVTRTTTATATAGQFVLANATSGGFTVTLPTSPAAGTLVAVKKIDATANVVTVAPGAGTIDGDANATIVSEDAGAVFEWDGSAWRVAAVMSGGGGATGLLPANNLSDLTSPATARTNLGLGALATQNTFPAQAGGAKAAEFYVWRQWHSGELVPPFNWEFAVPFVIPAGRTVAAVSAFVNVAASAGGIMRFGWRVDDNGWPGALQAELGTVTSTVTNMRTVTAAFSPPGGLFWVTVACQVAAPTWRVGGNFPLAMLDGSPVSSDVSTAGYRGSPIGQSVTGALPASFAGGTRASSTTADAQKAPYIVLTLA